MTRAKSRTIRDVLAEMQVNTMTTPTGENRNIALKEIKTLIKESKPEEMIEVSDDNDITPTFPDFYNQGTDDYEANLLKILGG